MTNVMLFNIVVVLQPTNEEVKEGDKGLVKAAKLAEPCFSKEDAIKIGYSLIPEDLRTDPRIQVIVRPF